MNEKQPRADMVMEWLGAYLDGELNEARQAWVEAHLANCAECRQELAELRALSSLLHADPAPAAERSTRAFTTGVLRGLPAAARPEMQLSWAARYLPLGLFGAWAVLQTLVFLSSAVLFGASYLPGLRGGLDGLLFLGGGWTGWLGEVLRLLGLTYDGGWLMTLAQIPWAGVLVFTELLLAGLFAVLFMAWMAGLWSARRANLRAH